MANKTYEFWENLKNYNNQILSVFIENNILVEEIKKIKKKKEKIINDFGCGSGNSFQILKDFKKINAIDYSKNMLEFAKKQKTGNEEFILSEIETLKLKEKADVSIAISSIIPNNLNDFYLKINNILNNTKKNGTLLLTFSSFESRIFSYQLDADFMFKQNINPVEIFQTIKNIEIKENFNTLGYMYSNSGLIQKQWLKEELLFRFEKYKFKKITIKKLEFNWETQIKKKEYSNYPKLWMWFVKINL